MTQQAQQVSQQIDKAQTVTAKQITDAAAAITPDIAPADAVAAFAAALGIQTPQQVENAIVAVGDDCNDFHEFVRVCMESQKANNAANVAVTIHPIEELLPIFRQWQVSIVGQTFSDDGSRIVAMTKFILANL